MEDGESISSSLCKILDKNCFNLTLFASCKVLFEYQHLCYAPKPALIILYKHKSMGKDHRFNSF